MTYYLTLINEQVCLLLVLFGTSAVVTLSFMVGCLKKKARLWGVYATGSNAPPGDSKSTAKPPTAPAPADSAPKKNSEKEEVEKKNLIKDNDKKEVKKEEKKDILKSKSEKNSKKSVENKEEEDNGYEQCAEMTPEQLKKIAEETPK